MSEYSGYDPDETPSPDENSTDDDFHVWMGRDWFDGGRGETWDDPMILDGEELYIGWEAECAMCGKERVINDSGYCSQCWQIWNS